MSTRRKHYRERSGIVRIAEQREIITVVVVSIAGAAAGVGTHEDFPTQLTRETDVVVWLCVAPLGGW